jgi:hypothetical protein
MDTKPEMPAADEPDFGPDSLDTEIFVVTNSVGVIDRTVRPTPEHVRREIEKNRPWLLKPDEPQGQADQGASSKELPKE